MRPQWLPTRADAPGIALTLLIGVFAVAVTRVLPPSPIVSDVLVAMLLGALLVNTPLGRIFRIGERRGEKEREPDRYAVGLRFVGKWVLRLAIVLMGLKVHLAFFGRTELVVVFAVALASIPSAFCVAHVLGVAFGVRRALTDLLAGGTMICGASAVNAIAPVAGARREEQGVAIAVVFLFSAVAMFSFRGVAHALGLDESSAGLWSGLAVNDLASAVAVGAQMGETGGVMAAASKSARILLLGPVLVALALARRTAVRGATPTLRKSIVDALPGFIVGYIALAVVRGVGDRLFGDAAAWKAVLAADRLALEVLMSTVAAGIGLHLAIRTVLSSGARAVAVGGGASLWVAGLTATMVSLLARGSERLALAIGGVAVVGTYVLFRTTANTPARVRLLVRRFERGERVTLEEAMALLDRAEERGELDEGFMRRLLERLSPAIGELIPARTSPLEHGEGCRWMTYWQGSSGWALVAVVREPGSSTPIHAHSHRLIGKAIEGRLEELRFREHEGAELELVSREVLTHESLVELEGLAALHVVRAVGPTPAIDLQFRGPELGGPGRLFRPVRRIDLTKLAVGARFAIDEDVDDRPGQAGDGPSSGRLPIAAA